MKFAVILSTVLFIVLSPETEARRGRDDKKLLVEIFIESLCRYSKKFIVENFYPAYSALSDRIDVEFYPYGKAERTQNEYDEWEFQCQHGTLECINNAKQSCGLDFIGDDQDRQVEFIFCTMSANSFSQCCDLLGLNKQAIEECAVGPRGEELQKEAAEETEKVMFKSGQVPTIVFNKVYNEDNSMAALGSFEEAFNRIYEETFGPKDE